MAVRLYLNHNVPTAIRDGLKLRGVDVLSAFEDDAHRLGDPELLDRAGELGRVLFSMDNDLLVEAAERQRTGRNFVGVVYVHQMSCSIGRCIEDLELIAEVMEPEQLRGSVQFLPL
jgi:hypothetical protein